MMTARKRQSSKAVPMALGATALISTLSGCATDSIGNQVDGTAPAAVSHIADLGERVLVPASADPMIGEALYSDAAQGFSTYDWAVSEYTPGGLQNVTWNRSHVALGETFLSLMITPPVERGKPFPSGEIQSIDTMGYGTYSAVLRPAVGSGLLSSFYARAEAGDDTGASTFGFAFQGKDPRDVYIRLMVDDEVLVQDKVSLDFNAAADFHVYTMDWTPDALVWFIDGEEVHRVERTLAPLPEQPGKMFANLWAGTPDQAHWMGRPRFPSGVSLDIACIAHQPMGKSGKICSAPLGAPQAMADVGEVG
ncbi:MAG: family 16 glycosylhydrolase [Pseudomonadota bacterium]